MSLSPIEAPDFSSYQYQAEFEDLNFRNLSFWAIVDTPPSKSFSRKSHRPLLVAECVDMRQWLSKPAGVLRESPAIGSGIGDVWIVNYRSAGILLIDAGLLRGFRCLSKLKKLKRR